MKIILICIIFGAISFPLGAHPIEEFQGLWKGQCESSSGEKFRMELTLGPRLKKSRLVFTIHYLLPQKNDLREYSVILNDQNPSQIFLDEGEGAIFEEKWERNKLYGLLRTGNIRMHSIFNFRSQSTLEIFMTIFSVTPNRVFGTTTQLLEDYGPQSLQTCLLKK